MGMPVSTSSCPGHGTLPTMPLEGLTIRTYGCYCSVLGVQPLWDTNSRAGRPAGAPPRRLALHLSDGSKQSRLATWSKTRGLRKEEFGRRAEAQGSTTA